MSNTTDNLIFLSFETTKTPEFIERKNVDWVLYGEDNLYPQYLTKLFNRSAKHNAIVTGKVNYIVGRGWDVDTIGQDLEQKASLLDFVKKNDLNELLKKSALDYEIYNGFALEIIYTKRGGKIAELHHIDFAKIRVNAENDEYYYSEDWSKKKQDENTGFREFTPFDPEEQNPSGTRLLYYTQYRPKNGVDVYTYPDYIGAIPYIDADYEIANFHINNLKNGFTAGTIISFNNGTPTDEDKRAIERKLKRKFTSTDKAGGLLISFSDSKDKEPSIVHMQQSDMDEQFIMLNDMVRSEIFTGHKVTSPNLFGVETDQGFGNRVEIAEKYELFQNTYVEPRQKTLEKQFNEVLSVNGYSARLEIIPTKPIQERISDDKVWEVMTPNEKREAAGLEPLNQEFSSKPDIEKILKDFEGCGVSRDKFTVLKRKPVKQVFSGQFDFEAQKQQFELEPLETQILMLLEENPEYDLARIAGILGVQYETVKETVEGLVEVGKIKRSVKPALIGEVEILEPTPEAKREVKKNKRVEITVRYSYEPIAGEEPIIEGTRDFCAKLIKMNKMWTAKEIQDISLRNNYDVFKYKGGWWTREGGNLTTPYCRHTWVKNVVKKEIIG